MSTQTLEEPTDPALAPKRTNLNDLSNELLINIIRHISTEIEFTQPQRPYGHRPLFLFLLVSKRLHQLTEPVLYHRFVEEFLGNPNALQHFLKRIILHPDLAKLVRVYHGRASDSLHHDNHLDVSCLKEEPIWATIKDRVTQISQNADEAKEWMNSIEEGNWEAVTALTLSLVPNVQELRFQGWSYTEEVYPILLRFMSRVRDHQSHGSIDTTLSLRHLRKITLEYWDTEGSMRLGLLLPFLSIPSVQTFWAKMVGDDTWNSTAHSFPHIKELSLKPANIDPDAFQKFLLSFPNLERLYYRSGFEEPTLEPPRLLPALDHLKSSLRELCLFNENYLGHDLEEFPIGSLAAFERLKIVRMDSTMLTGRFGQETVVGGFSSVQSLANALPKSLCHLQLLNCQYNGYLVSEIVHLISWKSSTFPNLATLDIEWERIVYPDKPSPSEPHKHPGFERAAALQLLEDMEAVGVEMVMPSKPPEPKFIHYMKQHDGSERGFFGNVRMNHRVEYPYEDYERLCEEYGCDPKTGKGPGIFY